MSLNHPFVNRSWITYEMDRNGSITTILHVEPTTPVRQASDLESSLVQAITDHMKQHDYIDRAEIVPRNG